MGVIGVPGGTGETSGPEEGVTAGIDGIAGIAGIAGMELEEPTELAGVTVLGAETAGFRGVESGEATPEFDFSL